MTMKISNEQSKQTKGKVRSPWVSQESILGFQEGSQHRTLPLYIWTLSGDVMRGTVAAIVHQEEPEK